MSTIIRWHTFHILISFGFWTDISFFSFFGSFFILLPKKVAEILKYWEREREKKKFKALWTWIWYCVSIYIFFFCCSCYWISMESIECNIQCTENAFIRKVNESWPNTRNNNLKFTRKKKTKIYTLLQNKNKNCCILLPCFTYYQIQTIQQMNMNKRV